MRITKHRLAEIIKEELDKNYYLLGKYQPGSPTILSIDFRNLKDAGENMPGGVAPNKISKLIVQAFYDNNADYFLHIPFSRRDEEYPSVRVNSKGGSGYTDPSQSKYQVFLKFDEEEQREDFKTKELDLIMQQINQAAADYEMELRQLPLRDTTTGKLFENKMQITKAKLKRIIKEEIEMVLKEVDPHTDFQTAIRAHQGREPGDAEGREERMQRIKVDRGLGPDFGETKKTDPLGKLDPELTKKLVDAAIFRRRPGWEKEGDPRQQRKQFKYNLAHPSLMRKGANPERTAAAVELTDAQVKAIFHKAGWPDD